MTFSGGKFVVHFKAVEARFLRASFSAFVDVMDIDRPRRFSLGVFGSWDREGWDTMDLFSRVLGFEIGGLDWFRKGNVPLRFVTRSSELMVSARTHARSPECRRRRFSARHPWSSSSFSTRQHRRNPLPTTIAIVTELFHPIPAA
uniref:Uncharacterized protein n=1 Tax=Leersia perrieri TaxID=77586 RepID=A0A0D9X697_9ORYZ